MFWCHHVDKIKYRIVVCNISEHITEYQLSFMRQFVLLCFMNGSLCNISAKVTQWLTMKTHIWSP